MSLSYDVAVIGAGYAGLMAAYAAQQSGRNTLLIAKGHGGTHLRTGCIDVLGYFDNQRVDRPLAAVAGLATTQPTHPYAVLGAEAVNASLILFKQAMASAGYPFEGDGQSNFLLPSALGVPRPTALAPRTMIAGDLRRDGPLASGPLTSGQILIVGFDNFKDFYPALIADNLLAAGHVSRAASVTAPGYEHEADLQAMVLARAFDNAGFRAALAARLEPLLRPGDRVGFPAVLGLVDALEALADLEARLGCPVFEIPTLPPSIPGMRIFTAFDRLLHAGGTRVQIGHPVIGFKSDGLQVTAVTSLSAARPKDWRCGSVVLATGGVSSGGIQVDSHRVAREAIFNLPVVAAAAVASTANAMSEPSDYFERRMPSLPGLAVDAALRPLGTDGTAAYLNLYAAGSLLTGAEPWREKSGEGISLASGWRTGH